MDFVSMEEGNNTNQIYQILRVCCLVADLVDGIYAILLVWRVSNSFIWNRHSFGRQRQTGGMFRAESD